MALNNSGTMNVVRLETTAQSRVKTMATTKVDKAARLSQRLKEAKPQKAAPASQPASAPAPTAVLSEGRTPPRRGRPPVDTAPVNLRMPVTMRERLAIEAGRRSIAERRNVTPQAVILELLEKYLPPADAPHG
jgi:hypothetical protein